MLPTDNLDRQSQELLIQLLIRDRSLSIFDSPEWFDDANPEPYLDLVERGLIEGISCEEIAGKVRINVAAGVCLSDSGRLLAKSILRERSRWPAGGGLVFLSHNKADKDLARSLGAQLKLVGADVWFDEWQIKAGDSIPGKLNEGLDAFSTFVVLWSEHSAQSDWVRVELEAALTRAISDQSLRVIPVVLDQAPVPTLLSSLRRLDLGGSADLRTVVAEVMGFQTDRERLIAIQNVLDDAEIDVKFVPGYGAIVACPNCGAGLERLHISSFDDKERDRVYAGFKCLECHYGDGGEI